MSPYPSVSEMQTQPYEVTRFSPWFSAGLPAYYLVVLMRIVASALHTPNDQANAGLTDGIPGQAARFHISFMLYLSAPTMEANCRSKLQNR